MLEMELYKVTYNARAGVQRKRLSDVKNGSPQKTFSKWVDLELRIENEKYFRAHPELNAMVQLFIYKVLDNILYLFADHQTLQVSTFIFAKLWGWPGAHLRDLFKHSRRFNSFGFTRSLSSSRSFF